MIMAASRTIENAIMRGGITSMTRSDLTSVPNAETVELSRNKP